ncbi:unnamed protein product [Lactuca virosa]|uniref:F-box domain-containing protein n=1 Tax=Lactuca virosa TaxID=75947 RepID=A0AAU9MTF8_9ASTR|nr:unnamed protein product [Lactuca virosa]
MEDNDISNSSNQFNDDGDENQIVQQLLRTNISRNTKELFWYDIRNFPDSLLIEILARLPVKSIFSFKSVCKHWQTLISHPSFCRFYYSILNSSSRPFRILFRYARLPNFKEFVIRLGTEIHSSSEFSVLFLSTPEERRLYDQFSVLSISNGFILCCSWSPTFVYYFCDPLTRQWITLPKRGPSYKLPCPIPIQLQELADGPIYCYGALHWEVRYNGLLAFDPYKDPKSVRLIPFPDDRDFLSKYLDSSSQLCGESQGTLRYFEVAHGHKQFYLFSMWSMKDYEKGEWCCEFKVRRSDLHSNNLELSNWLLDGWFLPLSFHPLNPNVVYLYCMEPEHIVSYNILNRRLDFACKPIDHGQSLCSVIPFVLPRWPVLVPIATFKSKKKRR